MIELEKDFIIESFKKDEARQTFTSYIKEPISFVLVKSYIRHIEKAQKEGFAGIIKQLRSAQDDLGKEYDTQIKIRSQSEQEA